MSAAVNARVGAVAGGQVSLKSLDHRGSGAVYPNSSSLALVITLAAPLKQFPLDTVYLCHVQQPPRRLASSSSSSSTARRRPEAATSSSSSSSSRLASERVQRERSRVITIWGTRARLRVQCARRAASDVSAAPLLLLLRRMPAASYDQLLSSFRQRRFGDTC